MMKAASKPAYEITDLNEDVARDGDGRRDGAGWAYLAAQALLSMPVDEAISTLLEQIGKDANADRAWLFKYDEALLRFRNTHEWSRGSIKSYLQDLQDAPVTMIAWLHQFLVENRAVMINDVSALPRAARDLQAEMLRQDDKSVVSVPVFSDGRLVACVGFDATRSHHRWGEDDVRALSRCATLIGLSFARSATTGRDDRSRGRPLASPFTPLIYLRLHGAVRGVATEEMLGLRSAKDYTQVFLVDGSIVLDLRSLTVWAGLLSQSQFLRIHRTAIVNLLHVETLDRHAGTSGERWDLKVRAVPQRWTVARAYRAELRSRLGI
ncbi:GAF domain-containing protein [Phyllobacterium sp. SB3]|uniref:GAF domain-containing protein n=1 Tax=Phyllobacterium sp. SB3 TaxID=3156073 RepID=UPI0032AFE0B0